MHVVLMVIQWCILPAFGVKKATSAAMWGLKLNEGVLAGVYSRCYI